MIQRGAPTEGENTLGRSKTDAALTTVSLTEMENVLTRNLLVQSGERIFVKDRDSRFLLVSAGWLAAYGQGRSLDEVIGRSDFDFFSETHASGARAEELKVMETGEPLLTQVGEEAFLERPRLWGQTLRLPLRDENGNIIGTWGIGQTAQTRAEQALSESRERLEASEHMRRLMFEGNPQAIFLYDQETLDVIAVNNAAVSIYGYSHEEWLSMKSTAVLPPEDVKACFATFALPGEQTDLGVRRFHARRHVYKDGSIHDVEVTSTDVTLDGRPCRVASVQDVTERNLAAAELATARDAAVEASNVKSAFLATISHEIRTPMNGVLGMTELLLDTPLDDDQRALAAQVAESGELMLELINDILDIAKIEAGQLEMDVADFALRETIEQACAVAALQADAKGLAFELRIADDVPEEARGDGRRLRQILLNLISNAVKFTTEGRVTVSVERLANASLRIEVLDTGIGISPEILDKMFEPFTQADVSTTRNFGGTGLGLAIARELAQLMGGTIGARSHAGTGSTFWIEIPLSPEVEADDPVSGPALTHDTTFSPWQAAPLILVAEDSPVNQIVAARTLERCGCRADVAGDGLEAIEMLAQRPYDAVLMDCQMPGMDGYEATRAIRASEPAGQRIPVIAMTAHAMAGDRERCLAAGMDDYITKPMHREQLIEALRRWIPDAPQESAA
jgi:PAS domain S-box-containing protein